MARGVFTEYPTLLYYLHRVRQWAYGILLGTRIAIYLSGVLGGLLVATLCQGFLHPGGFFRWAFLLTLVGATLGGLCALIIPAFFRNWTDEELAIKVEKRYPELDNKLINAVLLAQDDSVEMPGVVDKLVESVTQELQYYDLGKCLSTRELKRWGAVAGGIFCALLLYGVFSPARFQSSLRAILHPSSEVAMVGSVEIVSVEPGDTAVLSGSNVTIKLITKGGRKKNARIMIRTVQDTVKKSMFRIAEEEFIYSLDRITLNTEYQVAIGGSASRFYRIRVVERPLVESIDLEYEPPAYTGLEKRKEQGVAGSIRCVVGSKVTVTIHSSKDLAKGELVMMDGALRKLLPYEGNRKLASATFTVLKSGGYSVHITDIDGIKNEDPVIHPITALPDRPPLAEFVKPGKDVVISPGETVKLVLEAKDDFGVTEVKLLEKRSDGSPQRIAKVWSEFAEPKKAVVVYDWKFPAEVYQPGDTVEYYAIVVDNNSVAREPGRTETARYKVRIVDKDKLAEKRKEEVAQWEKKLTKILEDQKKARNLAMRLLEEEKVALVRAGALSLKDKQSTIRRETLLVAGEISETDERSTTIKAVLYKLTANEMAEAVRIPEVLSELEELGAFRKGIEKEISIQTSIIRTLEKILDILPELAESPKEEKIEDEGFDMSEEAREKLEELKDALKDFVEEQKKVIDATHELAKKPVDDFTEEDEQKLAELTAIEDKWSKFLKEAHSDLSKLPEQDFSNPSLLDELIEVTSEVEMAKGALEKKAVEIATAIEDAGAELAESLTTHIEKWLPDKPDRLKWQMEEPLGDYEVPMAELPKELEDLVGELMEEEEDLFEDIEDATSAWADSIDKGAGWDAMDGPISNMSAQGVTGNQLPNNSEIGGRSGEGRTGKSGGEFVEKTATGKGGRRTPTRLTPDAFEAGEVDDQSKEPAGGSTGGGKLSGAGGEGLEGPIPPDIQKKLRNLASRQAELRNKAEKIAIQFKIRNYPSLFEETLKEMKLIEEELGAGRYHNVLRRKNILLKGLSKSRMFLQGEIEVTRDRSASLPDYLQDEILDAMTGDPPHGYRELLKSYYEALSKTDKR